MKFSTATLFAVLASASFVSAAPTEQPNYETGLIVTRQDANEVLDILSEIKNLKAKRELADGDYAVELDRRADSLIGQLITALANSGIIGDVWQTITTDPTIKSTLAAIIKSTIQTAIVQGPALIKAFWNSGLIQKLFNTLINDSDLKSALFNIAKSLFSSAANILVNYGNNAANAAASSSNTAAASKRDLANIIPEDVLDKRDLASLITTIVTEIKNSGILKSLINKVLANPQQSISFLTSALKNGIVLFEDVYNWAKSSGVLDSALNFLKNNGGSIVKALGSFLAAALGSGTVTASQIDNASATAAATGAAATTVATTVATVAVAATDAAYKRMLY